MYHRSGDRPLDPTTLAVLFVLLKIALKYQTLPRSFRIVKGNYLPRASCCISLYKCFCWPAAGKLPLETKESSFREGTRVHDLLVNMLGNNHPSEIKLLCATQQRPFRGLPQASARLTASANLPLQWGATFVDDMSTSIHVCLSSIKQQSLKCVIICIHYNARHNKSI